MRGDIKDYDLTSYLPPFMQAYKEPVEALDAETPEFVLVWQAKDGVLYNRFIETADEYGISRYESMLDIHPSSEDTLESRRSRVRSLWFNTIPYTLKTLVQKLIVLCGSESDFTLTDDFEEGYTLTIEVSLTLYGQIEELERIIDTMLPCNIVADVQNVFNIESDGNYYAAGYTGYTDCIMITPDFNEEYNVVGASNVSLVMSVAEIMQIEESEE